MKRTLVVLSVLYFVFLTSNDFYGWEEQNRFLGLVFFEPSLVHFSDLVGWGHIPSWMLGSGAGYFARESLAISVSPEMVTLVLLASWAGWAGLRVARLALNRLMSSSFVLNRRPTRCSIQPYLPLQVDRECGS